jgi:hypothetical protein
MKQQVTISAELAKNMFWLACRYAIGRHSYVNTYAYDMGRMYDVLNADERRKSAQDIRQCIGDILRMMPYGFTLDCSIPYADRKPYEMFCDFMNTHEGIDITKVSSITCYKGKKTDEIDYIISRKDKERYECRVWETDLNDLQPWADLASMLDDSGHVKVTFADGPGRQHKEICYPCYVNETKDEKEGNGIIYSAPIPWSYKVVYRPLRYGMTHRYIDPKAITKLERIKEP